MLQGRQGAELLTLVALPGSIWSLSHLFVSSKHLVIVLLPGTREHRIAHRRAAPKNDEATARGHGRRPMRAQLAVHAWL